MALVDASGLEEFDTGTALYGLVSAGFLLAVGRSKPPAELAKEARIEEHRNLGAAFYRTGMFDEATRELRRVIDLRAHDAHARFFLGLIAMRHGDWAQAVEIFGEVANESEARPAIFHNLAYALERLGRFGEAGVALEESARRGGGDDARLGTSLGVLSLKLGNIANADATLGAARARWGRRSPPPTWFYYSALAAALNGDLDRAHALAREGIDVHPRAAVLYNMQAVIQERRGDHDAAARAAERGLQEDPGLPQLHKNLADCLYHAERYSEAAESYLRAIKLDPALGDDVYLKLGTIYLHQQDLEQATACWERALELDPGNERTRAYLERARAPIA